MALPSNVLDLGPWKLTLPVGSKGKPTEVFGKALATYTDQWFKVTPDGKGVAFRAPVNGVTTSGSKNPRSELREMTAAGKSASWTGKAGWHCLTVVEAFTHLPNARTDGGTAGVVGAQIHDASDDVTVFRLEGSKLWVTKGDNNHYKLITDKYVLGTPYVAQFVVYAGIITAYYNGAPVAVLDAKKLKGGYFKAGAYTQANCSNSKPCSADNFGETVVYWTSVLHSDKPGTRPTPSVPGTPAPPPPPTPVPDPPPAPVPVPSPAQTVIMIQRHAEKDDNDDGKDDVSHGLSKRGQQRALAIRDRGLFITPRADLAVPTYVLASQGGRMEQTAKPTADVLKLPIDVSLDVETAIDKAAALLVKQAKAGKTVWAVVEHKGIPALLKATAKLLGCSDKLPSSHADDDFHTGYAFRGAKFSIWQESVLPGDPGYVA